MTNIIDRRQGNKNKSAPNRKKFIDRYKEQIKESVDNIATKRSIKDVADKSKIKLNKKTIQEPEFKHNPKSGHKDIVLPGNDRFIVGDKPAKPKDGSGVASDGSPTGEGEDDFYFTLTKDEFIDLYFADMELPNFIKKSLQNDSTKQLRKAGYSKEGIPARLNIKKTFEHAIARKLAAKVQGKKTRYLDDTDIRYDYFVKEPKPLKKAIMFCLMDTSGSMEEHEKNLAKKFFLLLYLFLHKEYKHVELVFVKHTTEAKEVAESEFFYSRETGGTIVSSGLELINKIIAERYGAGDCNIYVAQCSDGDNWAKDDQYCIELLENKILPQVQYFSYLQVETEQRFASKREYGVHDLFYLYQQLKENHLNFNMGVATRDSQIYPVLHDLFKKGG